MENCIIFSLPGNTELANSLAKELDIKMGKMVIREFPDAESYIRIDSVVNNKTAILVCTLNQPNSKILPLMFAAKTIKELGAKKICLISPYIPYMRQDKRFQPGEAITAYHFAKLLSGWIDCLITVDPHLHRIHHLHDIYSISSLSTLHATKIIAEWIQKNIESPFLIGPDEESRQWVSEIAEYINVPFVICAKTRYGDRNVTVSIPDMKNTGKVPVIVDDIISTGTSMPAILQQMTQQGFKNPVCISVHALFDKEVENNLLAAGAEKIVTCNTIPHPTNKIDITGIIARGIVETC